MIWLSIPKPDIRGVSDKLAEEMHIVPYNDLTAAEKVLSEHADDIAGVIVEPFLRAGGVIPAKKEYLKVFNAAGKDPVTQSGTFNGNRATMAAGYAALMQYKQADCDRLEQLAIHLQTKMEDAIRSVGIFLAPRGLKTKKNIPE